MSTLPVLKQIVQSIEDSFGTVDDPASPNFGKPNIEVTREDGKLAFTNNCDVDIDLDINGIGNTLFTDFFTGLDRTINSGDTIYSSEIHSDKVKFDVGMKIYDDTGANYDTTFSFIKVDDTTWKFHAYTPNGTKIDSRSDINADNKFEEGFIYFDSFGNYMSQSPNNLSFYSPLTRDWQSINIDFSGIIATSNFSRTVDTFQNGFDFDELQEIQIDKNGIIQARSSADNDFKKVAQIALALFTDEQGLERIGNNYLRATQISGRPEIAKPSSSSSVGSLVSHALEASNVELAETLVDLMVKQRGYEANAKVITSSNDILNTLLQLKK